MAFDYREIVPWGRSYEEYLRMFALSESDLGQRLLGCGDGPASFNAGLTRRGRRVISVDPLYRLPATAIHERIRETSENVLGQTRRERHRFLWDTISSVEELGELRMRAMLDFLSDYESGRREGRYLAAGLPSLPFRSGEFDLALCSHLLFFYSDPLSLEFHRAALRELCRVANEVRVFPLVDVNAQTSAYLDPMLGELEGEGMGVEVRRVPYEFQKSANQMLRIHGSSG